MVNVEKAVLDEIERLGMLRLHGSGRAELSKHPRFREALQTGQIDRPLIELARMVKRRADPQSFADLYPPERVEDTARMAVIAREIELKYVSIRSFRKVLWGEEDPHPSKVQGLLLRMSEEELDPGSPLMRRWALWCSEFLPLSRPSDLAEAGAEKAFVQYLDSARQVSSQRIKVSGGPLSYLVPLSSEIARAVQWPEYDATTFILTGVARGRSHPWIAYVGNSSIPAASYIRVTFAADADADTIYALIREQQAQIHRDGYRRRRALDDVTLHRAIFRSSFPGDLPRGEPLVQAWEAYCVEAKITDRSASGKDPNKLRWLTERAYDLIRDPGLKPNDVLPTAEEDDF